MAVFSGAHKMNNEIKIISHVITSKMLTMGIKISKTRGFEEGVNPVSRTKEEEI